MEHHSAYGLSVESLDIVIVDDSKTVLTMIRSMLSALKVARVRSYDRGDLALQAIMHEPPHIILTDLAMTPMSGMQLLRLIRQKTMEPLCFIPVIVVTAHATQQRVAQLFESGAHHVLSKPLAASVLQQRIRSLVKDPRMMRLDGERYVIDGMHETLLEKQSRLESLDKARQFHEEVLPRAVEKQRTVDDILKGRPEVSEDLKRPVRRVSPGMRMGDQMRKDAVQAKKEKSRVGLSSRSRYAGVGKRRG